MLLRGLTWLVLFQLLGTALQVLLLPALPGTIIGMLLLLVYLLVRGEVSESVQRASTSLLRYLPLLLVPPAVGLMIYGEQLLADALGLAAALFFSLIGSLLFCGWLMQKLINRQTPKEPL